MSRSYVTALGELSTPQASTVPFVPPCQRCLEPLRADDLIERALLRRVPRVQDRRHVEVRVHCLAQTHGLVGAVESELRQPQDREWGDRNAFGQRPHRTFEVIGWDHPVDEPERESRLRVDEVTREEQQQHPPVRTRRGSSRHLLQTERGRWEHHRLPSSPTRQAGCFATADQSISSQPIAKRDLSVKLWR